MPPPVAVSRLKYISELMLLLPWNLQFFFDARADVATLNIYLVRFASRSLLDSPPKNMSELMDLAFPNLLTAPESLEATEVTGAGDLLGL